MSRISLSAYPRVFTSRPRPSLGKTGFSPLVMACAYVMSLPMGRKIQVKTAMVKTMMPIAIIVIDRLIHCLREVINGLMSCWALYTVRVPMMLFLCLMGTPM